MTNTIIATNTVWTAGSVHIFGSTDTLQVAPGATLAIQPGTTVSGASQRNTLNELASHRFYYLIPSA